MTDGSARDKWLASMDPGIAPFVSVLDAAGIETFESCQGGEGHAYAEPGIRFYGDRSEGFRALAIATQHALPVSEIRRFWSVDKAGEPQGPYWEITFWRSANSEDRRAARVQVAHMFQLRANSGLELLKQGLAEASPETWVA